MIMKQTEELNTLPKLLERVAAGRGRKVAIRVKCLGYWREISWEDYLERVRHLALGLRKLGLSRGDRACIQSENNEEWLYSDLAVQSVGAISVGVYPTNPASEVKHIVQDCRAKVFIAEDQESVDKIVEIKEQLPFLSHVIVMNMKGIRPVSDLDIIGFKDVEEIGRRAADEGGDDFHEMIAAGRPDDPAYLIYTSGTTNLPKGAVVTHRIALGSAYCCLDVVDFNDMDSHLSYLPLCHALERDFGICFHLICGYVVNFAENIDSVKENLQEIAPTIFIAVPRILEKMANDINIKISNTTRAKKAIFKICYGKGRILAGKALGKEPLTPIDLLTRFFVDLLVGRPIRTFLGLDRAKYVFSGGAPLPADLALFFHALGIRVRELFGMTELTNIVAMHYDDEIRIGTVGKVMPKWEIRIVDDELCCRGPGVMKGYWDNPGATAEVLDKDGWLRTGDLAAIDPAGQLKITGRRKDIIITSGGKNVSPVVIETGIKGLPVVKEVVVVGDGRNYLTALIQLDAEICGKWAQEKNITFATIRDLSRNKEVQAMLRENIAGINKDLARVEQIKKIGLIDKELYHEDGDMTATQKTKRSTICGKFASLIDSMYSNAESDLVIDVYGK